MERVQNTIREQCFHSTTLEGYFLSKSLFLCWFQHFAVYEAMIWWSSQGGQESPSPGHQPKIWATQWSKKIVANKEVDKNCKLFLPFCHCKILPGWAHGECWCGEGEAGGAQGQAGGGGGPSLGWRSREFQNLTKNKKIYFFLLLKLLGGQES